MDIPLVDLAFQHALIADEVQAGFARVARESSLKNHSGGICSRRAH